MKKFKMPSMNTSIAYSADLSNLIVAWILTNGVLLALSLSAIQVIAGLIMLSLDTISKFPAYSVIILLSGIVVAILIESLSISGMLTIRDSKIEKSKIDDKFNLIVNPTEVQLNLYKVDLKKNDRTFYIGVILTIVGIIFSAIIGDFFWSKVWSSVKPEWFAITLGYLVPVLIAWTFIRSELFKDASIASIVENLKEHTILQIVIESSKQKQKYYEALKTLDYTEHNLDNVQKNATELNKIVHKSVSNYFKQYARSMKNESFFVDSTITEIGNETLLLPSPNSRKKYKEHKDDLLKLVTEYPNVKQDIVSAKFSISSSTAHRWLQKIKEEYSL